MKLVGRSLWKPQIYLVRRRQHVIFSHGRFHLTPKKHINTETNNAHPVDEVNQLLTKKLLTRASSLVCEKISDFTPEQLSQMMVSFSKAYYSTGHIDDMVSFLDRLDTAPINHQDYSMTAAYNTIIDGILDTRGPADALEYWSKLSKSPKAPKPNQRTLEGLLSAALNCSPEWVAEVKKYMKENDMKVQSPYVSFQFIRHDLLCNNFDKAFAELQTWKPVPPEILVKDFVCLASRFTPDRLPVIFETYKDLWKKKSFVADVFQKMKRKGDTTGHITLFKLMKQAEIKCSIEAFEALLEVAIMSKRDDMVKSVIYTAKVEECKFSTTFYGLILFYYTSTNRKMAWKYFLQAESEGTAVEARILDALCSAEDDPAVLAEYTPKISDFAKKHRLKFEDTRIKFFADMMLRNMHYDQAVSWMRMLIFNSTQSKINRPIWWGLVNQLVQLKKWDQLHQVVDMLPDNLLFLVEQQLPLLARAMTEKREYAKVQKYLNEMAEIPIDLAKDILRICTKQDNKSMLKTFQTFFAEEGIAIE